MSALFAPHKDFLSATLADIPEGREAAQEREVVENNGVVFRLTGHGALTCAPSSPVGPKLVFSAGVHGNETAPIEIVNEIVSELLEGVHPVRRECLFLLGNPPAMRAQERFIDINLNRLFKESATTGPGYEPNRAAELIAQVQDFVPAGETCWHYDLHTAIRGSQIEKFAVYPFLPARQCPTLQLKLLAASGVEAVLLQNKPAATFSGWSAAEYAAESFTVELGKVHPFGENDLAGLANLKDQLLALIAGDDAAIKSHSGKLPEQYQVVDEIINTGKNFQLNIAEDTPNFTELEVGYSVWKDEETEYVVSGSPVRIVFPNSKVGPGQRAGLLVRPLPAMLLS
ncbi:succinylglutamate desuccinylase [Hahella sp. CR1]|uniref:succinylglutamate desuccinylase n=1 Tax=Hahella sp. CR1 TaxID=2992807 RepID=UPI0024415B12|nr:succinylglutamate desuccinylase [Hahella sp. CR1]MDG9668305.1 succinylglutamate desuccinylase [Hahella sp. CR1]